MAGSEGIPTLPPSRRSHAVHRPPNSEDKWPVVPRFKLQDIYLATCGFDPRFLVAHASLSQIFVAKRSNQIHLFVKRSWPGNRFWDSQRGLENEKCILSACKGTYLLNLVGVSDDTPERILMFEHAGRGNLFEILHNQALDPIHWPLRVQIAYHIAVALRGLHGARSQIVHRDVRSSNVWITDDWSAKLGGFEFAYKFSRSSCTLSASCRHKSMASIDPDYQGVGNLCAKTDVFCFGLILLEIVSGRKPVDVNNCPPFVVDWALPLIHQNKVDMLCDPRVRLPFQNSKVVLDMARIGMQCLNTVCSRRPAMANIADELKLLSLQFPPPNQRSHCSKSHRRSKMFDRSLCTSVKARLNLAGVGLTQAFRSERPSMMFGLLEPQNLPPRNFLDLLDDGVARKQRELSLPPHLRHEFI